jgi:hypothetical protein
MVGWPSGLGGGLQNLLHQFESDPDLNIRGCSSIGRMSVSKTEDEGSSPYIRAIGPLV